MLFVMPKMSDCGSRRWQSWANCILTVVNTGNCPGFWSSFTRVALRKMAKMIWRKARNCSRFTRLKSKCTPRKRTTRSWRRFMISRCTSSLPFHIRLFWESSVNVEEKCISGILLFSRFCEEDWPDFWLHFKPKICPFETQKQSTFKIKQPDFKGMQSNFREISHISGK